MLLKEEAVSGFLFNLSAKISAGIRLVEIFLGTSHLSIRFEARSGERSTIAIRWQARMSGGAGDRNPVVAQGSTNVVWSTFPCNAFHSVPYYRPMSSVDRKLRVKIENAISEFPVAISAETTEKRGPGDFVWFVLIG
jgi:hypothetical protein